MKTVTFVIPRISSDEMTVAIVMAELTPEGVKQRYDKANAFLPFLIDAVSKWVAETKEGRAEWERSSHDFNIGDLATMSDDYLAAIVRGVDQFMTSLKIECHVDLTNDSHGSEWTYDTVLVDDSAFEEIDDVA